MATDAKRSAGLAARYATALFELADEAKALDTVAGDLRQIRAALDESEDFVRLTRSPMIARDDKARAVDGLLAALGASDLVRRFVGVVAANARLFALPGMIDAFLAELARRRGEMVAHVTSTVPLDDGQLARLTQQLRDSMGAKVQVEAAVDPSLLGGLIVRVGSRMIDSSLATKLTRLQSAMKGVA